MDKATEELNKASHVLLDAEVRLNTITIQVEDLERQIAMLNFVESRLEENITVLQQKYVTVIMSEYRKALVDLKTCRNRRAFLRIDRENQLKIQDHCKTLYDKAKSEYENAFNMIHNPPNNVIEWDFGRKDDG